MIMKLTDYLEKKLECVFIKDDLFFKGDRIKDVIAVQIKGSIYYNKRLKEYSNTFYMEFALKNGKIIEGFVGAIALTEYFDSRARVILKLIGLEGIPCFVSANVVNSKKTLETASDYERWGYTKFLDFIQDYPINAYTFDELEGEAKNSASKWGNAYIYTKDGKLI